MILLRPRFVACACLFAAAMAGSALACGPPPDGWPGAGRSFTPPPVTMTNGSDAAPDSEPPPPPERDSGSPLVDSGSPIVDSGSPIVDSGPKD